MNPFNIKLWTLCCFIAAPSSLTACTANPAGQESAQERTLIQAALGDSDEQELDEACGGVVTRIALVQGAGAESPLDDQVVTIEGVVVGAFQDSSRDLGGFFLQDTQSDHDPLTSEGLFVYAPDAEPEVQLSDRVQVTGTVSEYYGLTEIVADRVQLCGAGDLPQPTQLYLPYASENALEAVEGMLVRLRELTVTETYDLGRYGELTLAGLERLFAETNGTGARASENARNRVVLDDGQFTQNAEPVAYLGPDGTLRLGDQLSELVAVMHYAFDSYRLQPIDQKEIIFSRENPRTSSPQKLTGDVTVASLNVLNYFVTLGGRGADTSSELERQRAKLVSAILGLDADVLGLIELENTPAALSDLVAAINEVNGEQLYKQAKDPAFLGSDSIRTGLIYKPARVLAVGPGTSSENEVFNRPPVAQTFSYLGNRFSVVVNHFKSKGSCPDDTSSSNADRGQGCWNAVRVKQAEALLDFVDELRDKSDEQDVVILGDLNSYLGEDPIQTLEDGGLINHMLEVPELDRYTYVFSGEAGVLDYGMSTPSLARRGINIWHINADEPRFLDYNQEFNPKAAFRPDPYRCSDHDPVILSFDLPAEPTNLISDWIAHVNRLFDEDQIRGDALVRVLAHAETARRALSLGESNVDSWALDYVSGTLALRQLHKARQLLMAQAEDEGQAMHSLLTELSTLIALLD